MPTSRNAGAAARFQTGQRVRAHNMHPVGHTRLPRYVRGKLGVIDRDHGVFVFPDTNAHFQGEKPQPVYSRCGFERESYGVSKAHPKIRCMWICGMTTLSQPNVIPRPENMTVVPELPRDAEWPVFAEPWQAEVFALAVKLSEQGSSHGRSGRLRLPKS